MMLRIIILWIVGGLLIIPYSIYRLVYDAQSDEYAFLIVMPLFWIFGFWGVVGPAITAYKIHGLMKALDHVQDKQELQEAYDRHDGKEIIVDLIATENHIPKFIARLIYDRVVKKLKENSPGKKV